MNIFVGNLSFATTGGDIKKLFEGFGNVVSVAISTRKNKKGSKSRGFGFVDMPDEQQALAAIAALNSKEFMGRALNVNPARPKTGPQVVRKSPVEHKPWKKPAGDAKPWRKPDGGIKPWKKPEVGFKPWRKPEGAARPWKKPAGDAKPWKKPAGEAKPWRKSSERPQESRFKGRRKPGGYKR